MFLLKKKTLRGNHAPFVYWKQTQKQVSKKPRQNYQKIVQHHRRKPIKHFSNITSNEIMTNKIFWKAIKPFLTNKSRLENSDIMLRDDEKMITDE